MSSSGSSPSQSNRMHTRILTTDLEMEGKRGTDGTEKSEKEIETDVSSNSVERRRAHTRILTTDLEMEGKRGTAGTEKSEKEIETDVSRRAPNMQPYLYMAAKRGDADFIKQRKAEDIEQNPVFSQETPKLNSVLHIAASFGHSQLVEAIEYDREFWKKKNSAGELAFHVATSCGHLSTLKKLVSVSCSSFLNFPNNEGNTPLHLALINKYREVDLVLKTKYSEIADYLVETNPIVSLFPNKEHNSPLHMAAEAGDAEMVKLMTEKLKGIKDGNTPLHLALKNKYREVDLILKTKYSEIANFLVETNPVVLHFPNKEHKSPLYMAAEAGDEEMVELMIEKADGTIIRTVDGDHIVLNQFIVIKSIAHAAIIGKNIDVLDSVMSENPSRIKDRDSEGMTPLSYAASIGYLEGVRYFLNKFTDCIYESDQNGFFPIHTASSRGHIEIVQEFIQRCPDSVELLNHQGRNILHVAALRGKAKVVNYMLKMPELEMLTNEKDEDGNTSLHLASKGWHPKVVSILTWDKRVDLKLLNNEGKTALDIAGKYSGKVPSSRERLTWLALRYAGAPHAARPSTTRENPLSSNPGEPSNMDKNKDAVKENSQSSKPREAPNMDYYKDRVNTLLLVATLVATVTFAAGFTVPGGNDDSDPHKGMAKFLRHHLFQAFIISNTIAMYSSVTVVVALIWAQLGDLNLVIASLKFAVPILGLALIMVSSAFMTGSYLMVRGLNWLAHLVLIIGSFFILLLVILYLPLCLPNSLPHPIFRYIVYYPFSLLIIVTKSNINDREEK